MIDKKIFDTPEIKKTRIAITIDEDLLEPLKKFAKKRKLNVSQIINRFLRSLLSENSLSKKEEGKK